MLAWYEHSSRLGPKVHAKEMGFDAVSFESRGFEWQ